MNNKVINSNLINKTTILYINNNLRSLGIRTSHIGFKFLNKAIQIKLNDELQNGFSTITLNEVYNQISIHYNNIKTPKQIKDDISYALYNRNDSLSKKSFEKIFGYSYSNEIFTTKTFIEEIISSLEFSLDF